MRAEHVDAAAFILRRIKEIDASLAQTPDSGGIRMKGSGGWLAFSDDALKEGWAVMCKQLQGERASLCRRAAQINLRLD